jgi:hypothetical protein
MALSGNQFFLVFTKSSGAAAAQEVQLSTATKIA